MSLRTTPLAWSSIRSLASLRAMAVGAALTFLGCSSSSPGAPPPGNTPDPTPSTGIALESVVSGLDDPVYVTSPPGDSRLFVVERPGRIRIIKNGQLLTAAFLDIDAKVNSGYAEQGLLSVAFHPQYAGNGLFYVNYTDNNGDTRVERYHVASDPDVADAASGQLVIGVAQPYDNHNGGLVMFGPDGMLYIGMGDGGSGGDPQGNGQNLNALLGKMLRLDVDSAEPYAIPGDNPFAGQAGKKGEIWAYGLRNPWRFCFDAGNLYIADVGQDRYEEINAMPASSKGLNYGWVVMEGLHCYSPAKNCDSAGKVLPVVEYSHSDGCSVTGGFVYRGNAIPSLKGCYVYGDYCGGWIRSFKYAAGVISDHREWKNVSVSGLSSFGQDAAGNLYVCSLGGTVYRVIPAPAAPAKARRR